MKTSNHSGKSTIINKTSTNKITYRKPTKQSKSFSKGKRMPCKVLTKEQINELYN